MNKFFYKEKNFDLNKIKNLFIEIFNLNCKIYYYKSI